MAMRKWLIGVGIAFAGVLAIPLLLAAAHFVIAYPAINECKYTTNGRPFIWSCSDWYDQCDRKDGCDYSEYWRAEFSVADDLARQDWRKVAVLDGQ